MKNYQNDYLSEFEQEFEMEFEADSENDEFENDEFENDEFELDSENNDEFENDEFENDEFENNTFGTSDRGYEQRLYEIFTSNYESELEYENAFNEVLHEMEQDFFWKKLKKFGKGLIKKVAPMAKGLLSQLPGGGKIFDVLKGITSDPRSFLRTAIKQFGPMALNAVIPGSGVVAGALLNNEVQSNPNAARQAARNTVAMAKQAYSGLANGMAQMPASNNVNQMRTQLQSIAQNAVNQIKRSGLNSTNRGKHQLVNRKVMNLDGGRYKIVTSVYKMR